MYKDFKIDANMLASITTLVKSHPTLVKPFVEAIDEWANNKYRSEVEREFLSAEDSDKYHELCLKFANAISDCADTLGEDTIYVPYSMHYQIRLSGVRNGNQVMNFLKPLITVD